MPPHMQHNDPDSRLLRMEEQHLFMERQIEELSGEVRLLSSVVDRLKRDLEAERARVGQLSDRLAQDASKENNSAPDIQDV